MSGASQTVYVLIGLDHDPMPEEPRRTRFWIAAGACPACGCAERRLVLDGPELAVECARCAERQPTGLHASRLPETSYVFWCASPRFECDDPPLTRGERDEIERLLAQLGEEAEPVLFGVVIEAGICRRTRDCINADCRYNHRAAGATSH